MELGAGERAEATSVSILHEMTQAMRVKLRSHLVMPEVFPCNDRTILTVMPDLIGLLKSGKIIPVISHNMQLSEIFFLYLRHERN